MNGVKPEDILYQLAAIATADPTQVVQVQDGALQVQSTQQLPKELRCAIASIEKSAGSIKVKFYDKLKALELLCKYTDLLGGSESAGKIIPLLDAILRSTGEVTNGEIQNIWQQAVAGDDMVEPEGVS